MSGRALNPSLLSRGPSTAKFYSEPLKMYARIPAADKGEILLSVYSNCPTVVGESSARLPSLAILIVVNAHIRNKLSSLENHSVWKDFFGGSKDDTVKSRRN
jgi:hypothetical protein